MIYAINRENLKPFHILISLMLESLDFLVCNLLDDVIIHTVMLILGKILCLMCTGSLYLD